MRDPESGLDIDWNAGVKGGQGISFENDNAVEELPRHSTANNNIIEQSSSGKDDSHSGISSSDAQGTEYQYIIYNT